MAAKKKTPEKKWNEDEFGVVTWGGYSQGDTWHAGGHEPFAKMLDILNKSPAVPQSFKDAAIHVHDDLDVARSIAVSLFGKHWREHVVDVYDRLQTKAALREAGE
jgi:hypothetical protein